MGLQARARPEPRRQGSAKDLMDPNLSASRCQAAFAVNRLGPQSPWLLAGFRTFWL